MTETPLYIELAKLQNEIETWQYRNFPNNKPYHPLLGLSEEVGELSHAHLKMEQGIRSSSMYDKEDAVGDIGVYLIAYCALNNIDFANAITKTWDQVRQRDWKKYPKNGRSE